MFSFVNTLTLLRNLSIINRMKRTLIAYILIALCSLQAYAEDTVSRIDIKGNSAVSTATVISKIKCRTGQPFNENVINEDIKNLNATGFFENIEAQKQHSTEGLVIIFILKEKPTVTKVTFEGNKHIRGKKLIETMSLKENAFIDEYKLKESSSAIRDLYTKKGFSSAKIVYETKLVADNKIEVKFIIQENSVVKIRSIIFEGNKAFSDSKLERVIKSRHAWLFNSGFYKEEVLRDDVKRLVDFYKMQGFSDASAVTNVTQLKKGISITVTIQEGRRYYVGSVLISGNKNISLADLTKEASLKKGSIFNEYAVYEESARIREAYTDKGYVFARVDYKNSFNADAQNMNVFFNIVENEIATIDTITIRGNTKTKDKIIRRQLRIYPLEQYSGKKVKKSKERLDNLGYFEEVRFDTQPGAKANTVDITVDVKEQKTGTFSFGGGYSSVDSFVGFVELRQSNFDFKNFQTFTGAGQDINISTSIGSYSKVFSLSFTQPYIFDSPYAFGFDLYRRQNQREEDIGYAYDETTNGGIVRFGREFSDQLNAGLHFRFEKVSIDNIADDVSEEFKREAGNNTLISVQPMISYDTRDNVFSTTRGILYTNEIQVAGGPLGGDKNFVKFFTRLSKYFPFWRKSALEIRLRVGLADTYGDTDFMPIFERYFLGGSSTIRGYDERDVGPLDAATENPIGGESLFNGNIEYVYPLMDFAKLAVFYDTGNVWEKQSGLFTTGLKSGYGLGMRIKTPIGPISLDYGIPVNKIAGKKGNGKLHFNMSRGF